jgi:hypothetical protein
VASIADRLIELGITPLGTEAFAPFSEAEIASVETTLNGPLPVDYKEILLQFGRSMFSTEVNCTPTHEPLYFGWFFGYSELMDAIGYLDGFLPETVIPIGEDGGGNLFCLGVRGKDTGKVYFHNHGFGWHADAERYRERGEPVPPDIRYQVVHQIATSFREFINNIEKVEEAS